LDPEVDGGIVGGAKKEIKEKVVKARRSFVVWALMVDG